MNAIRIKIYFSFLLLLLGLTSTLARDKKPVFNRTSLFVPEKIITDQSGAIYSLGFNGKGDSAVLVKTSPDGVVKWIAKLNFYQFQSRIAAVEMSLDSIGNLYLARIYFQFVTNQEDTTYIELNKFTPEGKLVYSFIKGTTKSVDHFDIELATDSRGNCYLATTIFLGMIEDKGPKSFGEAFVGFLTFRSYPHYQGYLLIKVDPDGEQIWDTVSPDSIEGTLKDLQVSSSGELVVSGKKYLVQYERTGKVKWFKNVTDTLGQICLDSQDNIYSVVSGTNLSYVNSYTSSGEQRWQQIVPYPLMNYTPVCIKESNHLLMLVVLKHNKYSIWGRFIELDENGIIQQQNTVGWHANTRSLIFCPYSKNTITIAGRISWSTKGLLFRHDHHRWFYGNITTEQLFGDNFFLSPKLKFKTEKMGNAKIITYRK